MSSLKNHDGNIMVVAQGTSDMTKDSFGRNDWNFVIDFEDFYVKKILLHNDINF